MFQRKQAISVIGKLGNTLLNNPSTSSFFLFVVSLINIYDKMAKKNTGIIHIELSWEKQV